MKIVIRIFTALSFIGFAVGAVVTVFEKASVAGGTWAATAVVSFITYSMEKARKKKENAKRGDR